MPTATDGVPQRPLAEEPRRVTPDEADDDVELGDYEAEARLLALHRAQQQAMLAGENGGDAANAAGYDDDADMYEECEEAEEPDEAYDAAAAAAAAKAQTSTLPAPRPAGDAAARAQSLIPKATPKAPRSTSITAKARTGSAKPRPAKNGVLPSPRKRTSVDGAPPKPRRKRKERKKVLNCTLCRYALIRELAAEFNFVIEDDDDVEKFGFNMIWADTVLPLQKLARLANWQRFNHFPSMHLLCRKGHLGLTLGRMRRAFPDDYSFFPRTWALRSERSQFAKHFSQQSSSRKTYIMKPNAGCQGKGIILTRDPLGAVEDGENYVVQEYMSKPLLIDGKKFDLRVYVLVTSVRHLSIMVFHDGLVRICADAYQKPTDSNLSNTCIHLTNYAVNKHSENFVFNQDAANSAVGNKRDFRFLNEWLESQGHDVAGFWAGIDDAIVKAVIAALPRLQHVYSSVFPHSNDGYTCFEVLGFDVLVDEKLRPWLLEVNHTPSFHTDTPLDHRIKHSLLHEVWSIVRVSPNDKARHLARERALRARRLGAAMNTSTTTLPPAAGASSSTPPEGDVLPDPLAADVIDPQAVIALEDARRRNFRRAYPHPDPMKQAKYELLIRGSRDANEDKTTASQEARNLEVRAERDKREARLEAERMLMPQASRSGAGGSAATASSAPGAASSPSAASPVATDANGNGNTFASTAKAWASQLRGGGPPPTTANDNGNATATSAPPASGNDASTAAGSSNAASGQPAVPRGRRPASPGTAAAAQQHAMSAPPIRGHHRETSNSSAHSGPSTPPSLPPQGQGTARGSNNGVARPRPPAPDPKVMRDRLHEQMEKHRRRMVLGPRLSVFQLRDTQLETVLQQQPPPQQQQHATTSGTDPRSSAPGDSSSSDASLRSPPPPIAGVSPVTGGTRLPPTGSFARDKGVPTLPPPSQHHGGSNAGPGHHNHYQATSFSRQIQQQQAASGRGGGAQHQPLPQAAPASGRGGQASADAHAVAVSAATLQSHWLYHYDS